jgi:hypothetical protein
MAYRIYEMPRQNRSARVTHSAREVGGRSLLGPLRRVATGQVLQAANDLIRAVLRFATASGAARLYQRASPSLLPLTPLAGFSCVKDTENGARPSWCATARIFLLKNAVTKIYF